MKKNALVACLVVASFLNAADSVAAPGHSHRGGASAQKTQHKVKSRLHGQTSLRLSSSARHSPAKTGHAPLAQSGPARPFVIAIDAGHGGKDTGAIGYNGTYEKDVVYAISRRLESLIRAEPGMRAVMVRRGDNFIALNRRAEIARHAGADLFISVHADAHTDAAARGSAVFTLLPRRVEVEHFAKGTLKVSNRAAGKVLGEMRKKQSVHYSHVKKARFAVLKSPDVPSMLIETGFISNPEEERNLASPPYQGKVARSIFNGISAYFHAFRPVPGISIKGKEVVVASRQ